jgi:hypothetical protein
MIRSDVPLLVFPTSINWRGFEHYVQIGGDTKPRFVQVTRIAM